MDSSELYAISLAEQSAQSPVKQEELEQGANCPPTHTHVHVVISPIKRGTQGWVLIQAREKNHTDLEMVVDSMLTQSL